MCRRFVLLLSVVLFAASCQSEVREAIIKQEKAIDEYIQRQFPDNPVEYIDGVARVLLADAGSGALPVAAKNDSLYIYYAGYTFVDGAPTGCFVLDSGMVQIGKGHLIRGLDKGLEGVRQAQEVMLLFSSQYGYGSDKVGLVPENTALLFDVAVARVIKNN